LFTEFSSLKVHFELGYWQKKPLKRTSSVRGTACKLGRGPGLDIKKKGKDKLPEAKVTGTSCAGSEHHFNFPSSPSKASSQRMERVLPKYTTDDFAMKIC